MINDSKDILFLVLAAAAGVLTVFLCWLLYYLISMLRRANTALREVVDGFEKIHGILDALRAAANQSTSHLALIVGTVQKLVNLYLERRRAQPSKQRTSKNAKA